LISYILRRLVAAVVLLLLVSLVTFAIFFLVPRLAGASADSLASQYVGRSATGPQIHQRAIQLGFTDPLYKQYGEFIKGIFAGRQYDLGGPAPLHCPAPCLGYSFRNQTAVLPNLMNRLPVTLSVAVGGAVIWLLVGVSTGVVSALRRGSVFDRTAMGIALAGVSLPIFFTGLLALSLFSYTLHIFPAGGTYTPILQNPIHWAYDLILPWVTLAFLYAAGYARLTRAGMLETMNEDYIRTARAKGLPERVVVMKHALRSTLTPVLTIFGLDLGLLLGGAILTESTYSLNGLGSYTIQSIENNDLPVVLGVTMLAALFVVLANLVVDILYAFIDPRVRL
jgi:peptide/nickel transport system permease protein